MASGFDRMGRGSVVWQSELAKGERVRYLNRPRLPMHWPCHKPASVVSASSVILRCDSNCNKVAREFSHLGHLDFLSERNGDGANFCVSNEEKDGESERYAMIFIADLSHLTPPPALCPHINGSAVLKSDDKLSRETKCQR